MSVSRASLHRVAISRPRLQTGFVLVIQINFFHIFLEDQGADPPTSTSPHPPSLPSVPCIHTLPSSQVHPPPLLLNALIIKLRFPHRETTSHPRGPPQTLSPLIRCVSTGATLPFPKETVPFRPEAIINDFANHKLRGWFQCHRFELSNFSLLYLLS